MDPDAALENARKALSSLRAAQDGDSNDVEFDAANDLADAFEALDDWLTKGGFLPKAWSR